MLCRTHFLHPIYHGFTVQWTQSRRQAASITESSLLGTSLPFIAGSVSPLETWEEVDISSTDYARRRSELIQMMADLRSMGADALIDLPSVVVIGGQSAGKSSLVEAVSGFSRNVVCVSIEDPDATDLSFYDLPGLIQNEEAEIVTLVKNLVEYYTKKENTIILTTIPMSDDVENQQSMSLARAADPDGKRTIGKSSIPYYKSIIQRSLGVLTKPDTLGAGAINQRRKWVEIIEGRSEDHTLRHGFYCACRRIFDTTSPWKDVTDRHRFGIPGFVSDVSRLLIQLIEETDDVDKLLAKCIKDLDKLPPPLANDPQIEVLGRVNTFCDVFKRFVNGSHEDKCLAQRNRTLYAIFKRDIRGTAPDFRPFSHPEHYVPLDDTEGNMTLSERDPGVKVVGINDIHKVIQEAIGWELPNNVPYQAKANLIAQFTKLWVAPSERCLPGINDVLDEVINTVISTHFGRFKVLEDYFGNLIRIQVDICKAHAQVADKSALDLETTPHYTQNTHYLQTLRDKWLSRYKTVRSRPSQYKVRHIREDEVPVPPRPETPKRPSPDNDCKEWGQEYSSPIVSQTSAFLSPAYAVPSESKSSKTKTRINSTLLANTPEDKALRALAEAGYANLRVSDLARLLPPDSFKEELIVMADRIVDHIPFTIAHALHHALAGQLSQSLLTSLLTDIASAPNFSERMNELVSEDAFIAHRRIMLSTRKQRLLDIRRRLVTFSSST
ncbi:hypothetical protein F4604DRAFT_1933686 [Suillus subluteus]|nr:hypothetical protein F4604DRAFT_1933686 [Suillus subluteus]